MWAYRTVYHSTLFDMASDKGKKQLNNLPILNGAWVSYSRGEFIFFLLGNIHNFLIAMIGMPD